jgi:hypothetical protein
VVRSWPNLWQAYYPQHLPCGLVVPQGLSLLYDILDHFICMCSYFSRALTLNRSTSLTPTSPLLYLLLCNFLWISGVLYHENIFGFHFTFYLEQNKRFF